MQHFKHDNKRFGISPESRVRVTIKILEVRVKVRERIQEEAKQKVCKSKKKVSVVRISGNQENNMLCVIKRMSEP